MLIIDVQIGLVAMMSAELTNQVLPNIRALLDVARSAGTAVFFVQHDGPKEHPLEVGTPGWAIDPSIPPLPGEPIIRKQASDSFFETPLAEQLHAAGINSLVIAGGMTEYCIDTTCRRALTLGFDVTLVGNAHLTRDNSVLTAAQIVAHHNLILDGFEAGANSIKVTPTNRISF